MQEEIETTQEVTVENTRKTKKEKGSSGGKVQIYRGIKQTWSSRKLWMTIFAFLLNFWAYYQEMLFLRTLTSAEQINAFVGITRDFHWVTGGMLLTYLGVQGAVEWRHGTTAVVNQAISMVKNHNVNENIQHIIEEGADGAPVIKPFSQPATNS